MLLKKGNDLWKTFLYDYNPGILIGNPVAMDRHRASLKLYYSLLV